MRVVVEGSREGDVTVPRVSLTRKRRATGAAVRRSWLIALRTLAT